MLRTIKPLLLLTALVLLAGCAIKPKAITAVEAQETAEELQSNAQPEQEPLPSIMNLDEAIARALKYNLEHRVKIFEVSLRQRQYDLSIFDMLPELSVRGESQHRSNWDASVSRNLDTGERSTTYTTSDDRDKHTGELAFSWNILDLGVSYYTTHQQANRYLIAKEQQRKAVQNLVGETRVAFFKVLIAQELHDDISLALQEAEEALTLAKNVEDERLRPMEEILNYQKSLLQMIRQLEELQRGLAMARVQLAALMNLPSDQLPSLKKPDWYGSIRELSLSSPEMENYAFTHRPEIFEWGYQQRITAIEAKKAILDLVPGMGINLSTNYDSNSFDRDSNWQQASVHVAYNLMNIIKWPSKKKMLNVQKEMERAQGLALGMAILTQVNLANQQHEFAAKAVDRAQVLSKVEERLKELSQRQVSQGQGMRLDSIQKSVSAITGRLNREEAYINYYQALNNLYTAMGVDYLDYSNLPSELDGLTGVIAEANEQLWGKGDLTLLLAKPAPTAKDNQKE